MELSAHTLYPHGMPRTSDRSPTPALILGLVITLAAVVAYSGYITRQIDRKSVV